MTSRSEGHCRRDDVLRGRDTARVRKLGHQELSTFGLLADHAAMEVRAWIDQLVALGHLRQSEGGYPTLYLSAEGVEVMRGERPIALARVKAPKARASRRSSSKAAFDDLPVDERLFERLRSLRRELARERGVPPYIVFGDRALAQMAAYRPISSGTISPVK